MANTNELLARINKDANHRRAYLQAWIDFLAGEILDFDIPALNLVEMRNSFRGQSPSIDREIACFDDTEFLTLDIDSEYYIDNLFEDFQSIGSDPGCCCHSEEGLYIELAIPIDSLLVERMDALLASVATTAQTKTQTKTQTKKQENEAMNTVKNTLATATKTNVSAAKITAQVAVGKAANKTVINMIKPQLPLMVRGYIDTPLGALFAANLVMVGSTHFLDNGKLQQVAQAMIQSSMLDVLAQIDIDGLVDKLMESIPKGAMDKLSKAE